MRNKRKVFDFLSSVSNGLMKKKYYSEKLKNFHFFGIIGYNNYISGKE